jgi:AraC-like DNA-binding protein
MRPKEPARQHTSVRTADLDSAQDAVGRIFTPHRLKLVGRTTPLDARLDAASFGSVTTGRLRYGADVHLLNLEALGSYHVNIPLAGQTESRSGAASVVSTPERAAVFVPDLPGEIRWRADCTQLCVKFDREALELELEALLGRPTTKPIKFAASMDLTTSASQSWLAAVTLLEREYRRPDSVVLQAPAATHFEHLLLTGFLLAHAHNYSETLANARPRAQPRAIKQAIDLIESAPGAPLTAPDLARRVGISVRALQEGFKEYVGMPPMTYLREVRLTRAHDELRDAPPGAVAVAEVASRWGFTHLGRFGVAYRRKFGVPPSRTMRDGRIS